MDNILNYKSKFIKFSQIDKADSTVKIEKSFQQKL